MKNRFVVVWTDYRNMGGNPDIFAQVYQDFQPIGSNFQVIRIQHLTIIREDAGYPAIMKKSFFLGRITGIKKAGISMVNYLIGDLQV